MGEMQKMEFIEFYFHRIAVALRYINDEKLADYSITNRQARLLGKIRVGIDGGVAITRKYLEEVMQLSGPSVTSLLNGLEKNGFISRSAEGCPWSIDITQKGRRLMADLHSVFETTEAQLLAGLTEAEVRQLQELMIKVHANVSTEGGRENAGPKVAFHDAQSVDDALFKYAVIAARSNGRWIFCRHKKRHTWEIPGGHREQGETVEETARRELFEETGALEFTLRPVSAYSVEAGDTSYGMLYYADVAELGALPETEIEEIAFFDGLPHRLTYPAIQPKLFELVLSKAELYV